jgi:FkbM family methyltransferase
VISEEDVIWAFRMLLDRDPESRVVIDHHIHHVSPPTREGLRAMIMRSSEFAGAMTRLGFRLVDETESDDLIAPFLDLSDKPGDPDMFRDRFGVLTRCSYLPASYDAYAGKVATSGDDVGMPLHDPAELHGLLLSARDAHGSFTVVELGAGWGPWLVLGAKLAAQRGLPCRLVGVEASAEHLAFMHSHFYDNALNPNDHLLLHAAVGPEDGVARFPKLPEARADWGTQAKFETSPTVDENEDVIPCMSVTSLLARADPVDLLHCDVQGAEYDALAPAISALSRRVSRIVIGTHSRLIEANLFTLLSSHGWQLEHEQACIMNQQSDGSMVLAADGVQTWCNPAWSR